MFKQAGPVMLKLGRVVFAEPKFAKGPSDFDICIECTNAEDPAQSDWWRGEMSQNYGKGNFATMTQAEITMKTLRAIGFEGDDLTMLEEQFACCDPVPGMIKATTKKNDDGSEHTYYNIQYLGGGGGGNAPKAEDTLSSDAIKKRMAALMGGEKEAPATAKKAKATEPKEANPFL